LHFGPRLLMGLILPVILVEWLRWRRSRGA
jgi:hypothetical protein